ncbi:MAG: hypothetical protein UT94_C0007G0014 [Candidatus Uhrbacteria bacterium GW2011_GWF2_40_263]|nr:MAG: hypothetical protein UT94_C0007G0014 [Candidatus Uhrbacteria bacterium GW2011_GWF2_40_263]
MYPILKEIQILIILLLYPLKGGDPPTASATGALLRLRPYHSGVTNSLDVTGGEYKTRERIHGHVADWPLLAIPTS